MRKKSILLALVLCLLASVLFAAPEYIVEEVTGNPGGTFFVGALGGPKTFNPCEAQETSSTDILDRMFETLVDLDKDFGIRSGSIAKNWEVTPEGNGWIFYIREGLQWSDGHPLTVEDVYWSFNNVWLVPNLVTANTIDVLKDGDGNVPKVEIVGENGFKIYYPQPFAPGLRSIGSVQILPKHKLEQAVIDGAISEKWTVADVADLVGSGPFVVTEYLPEQRVVMTKNPYYFRVDKDGNKLPYFDKFIWIICGDQNTMRLKFETGETDFFAVSAPDYPDIKEMEAEKNWVVDAYGPTTGTLFFAMNMTSSDPVKNAWYKNVHFRKAVSHAMDRDTMIDVIYSGLAMPQWGPVSPASPFYDPEIEENYTYEHSFELAREELAKGGFTWDAEGKLHDKYGNLVEFKLTTNAGNSTREQACNLLKDVLEKIGMTVHFTPIDFNTLVQKLMGTGDWETMIMGLTGGVDPHSGSNVERIDGGLHFWNYNPEVADFVNRDEYSIPYYDWKIDQIYRQQTKEMDPDARWALFSEYQKLSAENVPLVYTVMQLRLYAYKAELKNIEIGGFSSWGWNIWAICKE